MKFRPSSLMSRRSAFEIRMDILRAVGSGGSKPTHIMYSSNTSWAVLQRNLESLLTGGFVLKCGEPSRTEYEITAKGTKVLHEYDRVVSEARGHPIQVQADGGIQSGVPIEP